MYIKILVEQDVQNGRKLVEELQQKGLPNCGCILVESRGSEGM